MENNGSSENIVEKALEGPASKKIKDVQKEILKISYYPETYEYSSKSIDRHNVISNNRMVKHYSTVTWNKSYIQSKSDTAIALSTSQPIKKTKHLNQLKHIDLEDYLNDKGSNKKHVKRAGHIYHPEVVTKYVFNRKDTFNYDAQSNHKKSQDFFRLLNEPNIMNELQYLDKKDNVDNINTDDRNTKSKPEYSDTEKVTDKHEYLDPPEHLYKVVDHENLKDISKIITIATPDSMIFNTEDFAKHTLLNKLDYKITKEMLDNSLDYFSKNENIEVEKSRPVSTSKLAYFPKQIVKSKNVGKRDDTENKSVIEKSTNIYTEKNEKYNIEHDYIFKQEFRNRAKTTDVPDVNDGRPENTKEPEYTTARTYTLKVKNDHDDENDYSMNAFDLENTLAIENTLAKADIELITSDFVSNTKEYNQMITITTPGLRIQESFRKTAAGTMGPRMNLTSTMFIEKTTQRQLNTTTGT